MMVHTIFKKLPLALTCLNCGTEKRFFDREAVRTLLKRDKVEIEIDLKSGRESAVAWGCDLSKKYVEINSEYS